MPWRLIGERVTVLVGGGEIRVVRAGTEVARHAVRVGRHGRVIDPAHFEGITGASEWRPASKPAAPGVNALGMPEPPPIPPPIPALLRPLAEYEAVAGGSF